MAFHIVERLLNGIVVFRPDIFSDERGFFVEQFRSDYLQEIGVHDNVVQENHSGSIKNVIRGMHFQWDKPMGKLIRVIRGEALFMEIDIRYNSPTLGKHCSIRVSEENRKLVWVPPGFANGFLSLSEKTEIQYLCTAIWSPTCEGAILWNDPAIGIDWGIDEPLLSSKDAMAPTLKEWLERPESRLFSL